MMATLSSNGGTEKEKLPGPMNALRRRCRADRTTGEQELTLASHWRTRILEGVLYGGCQILASGHGLAFLPVPKAGRGIDGTEKVPAERFLGRPRSLGRGETRLSRGVWRGFMLVCRRCPQVVWLGPGRAKQQGWRRPGLQGL